MSEGIGSSQSRVQVMVNRWNKRGLISPSKPHWYSPRRKQMQCSLCLLPLLQKLGKRTPLFKRQRKPFSLGTSMCFVLLYWIPAHQMTWQVLSFIHSAFFFPYLTWDSLTSPIFFYNCPSFRAEKHDVIWTIRKYVKRETLFSVSSTLCHISFSFVSK